MPKAPSAPVKPGKKTSIVYLGHIPAAFEEPQMRQFFTQFGPIKHLRLSRNKKSGASKHYAFIEFETPDVAEIVASTMNNYILFGRRLICEVMKAEAVDEHIWKGANRKFHVVNTAEKAANTMNARKSPDEVKTTLQKKLEKIQMQIDEMKASGKDSSVLEETNKSYKEALAALEKEGKKKEKVEKETKKEAKSEKKEDKKEKKDKEMKKDKKEKMEKPVKRNPKTKKVVKM
ncbi:ribosomal biogenesis protein [Blastocystis sp. subtype 4]|uniref:ribosomal biogenesis protein n=1 Tax=Blastocystis sp. subtype 4 TaxID=944170 RepID=UPI0007117C6C|nr:ribosomal biogenesis protein [Blastocystis sp. subtype 4]KNB43488.1 ribosomal biogenesis protein [Blastocystis sp. subtype 4]|eukprot:XP_014526931.1 ribosomal biogenesis protein [Blastocystis sp. subtype 4]